MSGIGEKGPVLALREAITAHLSSDEELKNLISGPRIYDEVPRGIQGTYLVYSDTRLRDWSTGSDKGYEQDFAITVWSAEGGARSALLAAARIAKLLEEAELTLDGHRLVNIGMTSSETKRDVRANRSRVVMRIRAVTEVLPEES